MSQPGNEDIQRDNVVDAYQWARLYTAIDGNSLINEFSVIKSNVCIGVKVNIGVRVFTEENAIIREPEWLRSKLIGIG